MNPLLYKPHPLFLRWAEWLAHPYAHESEVLAVLLAILALNGYFSLSLSLVLRRVAGVRPRFSASFLLAFPACLLYVPPMLTVLGDVLTGRFHWEDRFIPVFAIFVASQILAGFYTVVVRRRRTLEPIGVEAGAAVALWLLLAAMPACLVLLGLYALGVFPF